jgi:hypothetical protein
MGPYVAQARNTYPQAKRRFLQGLPRGYVLFVTTRLRDSKEHWEQALRAENPRLDWTIANPDGTRRE